MNDEYRLKSESLLPLCVVNRRFLRHVLTLLLAIAMPRELQADEQFEAKTYSVLVSVTFGHDAGFSENYRHSTLQQLRETLERGFGAKWQLEIGENGWLFPANASRLDRITLRSLRSHIDTSRFDKAFFVTVDRIGARYGVAVRPWEAATRALGPVASAESFERGDLAATMAGVIGRLFEPLLKVERVEGRHVILRSRAGRYTAPGVPSAHVRPGDVIQPFFRYLDEKQVVRRIQKLPWTYLVADEVDGGRIKCTLISGLRSPLGGSRRRSVEVMAIRVRPHFAATRLQLVPQGNRSKPLIGYGVSVVPKRTVRDEPTGESSHFVTNRDGEVEIPQAAGDPIVWLYVRSGESLLSRVPFVPGIDAVATMELPDDSIRLGVEGATDLLMIRLVDTVAKRAVHIARARIQAREGDWKNVGKQLSAIDKLPVIRNFESELTLIRVGAVEEAKRKKNRSAEANVMRVCSRVSNLIKRYLDEGPVRTLKIDISELKKLDAEDKRLLEEE